MKTKKKNIYIIITVVVIYGLVISLIIRNIKYSSGSYIYFTDTLTHNRVTMLPGIGNVIFWSKYKKLSISDFRFVKVNDSEKKVAHLVCNALSDYNLKGDTFVYKVEAFIYYDSSFWRVRNTDGYSIERLMKYNTRENETLQNDQIWFDLSEVEARYKRRFLSHNRNFNSTVYIDDSLNKISDQFNYLHNEFNREVVLPNDSIERRKWSNSVKAELEALHDFENPIGYIINKKD